MTKAKAKQVQEGECMETANDTPKVEVERPLYIEERIAKLEALLAELKGKLEDLEDKVSDIEDDVEDKVDSRDIDCEVDRFLENKDLPDEDRVNDMIDEAIDNLRVVIRKS